jgi:hypothetical protein
MQLIFFMFKIAHLRSKKVIKVNPSAYANQLKLGRTERMAGIE